MSRYDGLIIPRSYSEYINKTDAATLQQALQLSGVLSGAVAAGDNKAVTSNAVNGALFANLILDTKWVEIDTPYSLTGLEGNKGYLIFAESWSQQSLLDIYFYFATETRVVTKLLGAGTYSRVSASSATTLVLDSSGLQVQYKVIKLI